MKRIIFTICVINCFVFGIIKLNAQNKLYQNEFPLEDVTLLEGLFKHARDLNIEVLLKYDVDRLLAPYRKEAGLPEKAECYPNWAGLDGHVGGHYLSAMAMNYIATGNQECKKRMEYMLSELKECQEANAINNSDWGLVMLAVFLIVKIYGRLLKRAILASIVLAGHRFIICIKCMLGCVMPGYMLTMKKQKQCSLNFVIGVLTSFPTYPMNKCKQYLTRNMGG
jgi:hypothetical protein